MIILTITKTSICRSIKVYVGETSGKNYGLFIANENKNQIKVGHNALHCVFEINLIKMKFKGHCVGSFSLLLRKTKYVVVKQNVPESHGNCFPLERLLLLKSFSADFQVRVIDRNKSKHNISVFVWLN